jgi:hypothetical protein
MSLINARRISARSAKLACVIRRDSLSLRTLRPRAALRRLWALAKDSDSVTAPPGILRVPKPKIPSDVQDRAQSCHGTDESATAQYRGSRIHLFAQHEGTAGIRDHCPDLHRFEVDESPSAVELALRPVRALPRDASRRRGLRFVSNPRINMHLLGG